METKLIEQQTYNEGLNLSSYENTLNQQSEMLPRRIEDRYRSFLEKIEQAYFEIDTTGKFLFFNDHLCEMLGCTKDELRGNNLMRFLDKEESMRVRKAFREIFETDKAKSGLVFQVVRKDGLKRQIGTSVCLNVDMLNRKIGFQAIARDISQRKNHEDQLNQTRRLESIGQLAAGIAHEINTPVQYISDNIQFLKDSFKDVLALIDSALSVVRGAKTAPIEDSAIAEIEKMMMDTDSDYIIDEIPRAIEQSITGLQRVSKIVSAMKQFCHPGIEEKQASDINKAVENVITVTRNEWKYVADVITELDETLPLVPCLPGEINQVILNLIINAIDAIKDVIGQRENEKGTIRIRTSHKDSWAEVRISDSGTGIPQEIRSKIFDPFFTSKDVGKGTGQGLAISHSMVVNNHGGTLGFETEPGRGTTMIVRLPLRGNNE